MIRTLVVTTVCVSSVLGAGCSREPEGGDRLNGGGSTFVYPMMSKWSTEYEKAKGVKVDYQSIGSGGGIQKMTARDFDFGCTDAPLNEEQLEEARKNGGEVLHIPLVMGAVVPIYNVPGLDNQKPLKFTGPVLADIFLGKITRWNDEAIRKMNEGVKLPDQKISVVHRSDGSGTTYIWVDYLSKVSPGWKKKVGVGTSVQWPVGVGQKGNEGVARQTNATPGAIGYVELIYALQKKLGYGWVRNRENQFIEPSLEGVTEAAKGALTAIPEDLRYSLTNAPGQGTYPISGTVWAVLYKNPGAKGQELVNFLRWVTHEGQDLAKDLHYARLPKELIDRTDKKLDQVKTGK